MPKPRTQSGEKNLISQRLIELRKTHNMSQRDLAYKLQLAGYDMDMKKYFKEIAILIAQLLMFYVFPLTAGPTDAMGMVFLIIVATFVLAIIMGSVSKKKAKYVYPLLVSVLFIPSVFIYYNDSALIHSIWYLVISSVGLLIGALMQYFFSRK